MTTVESLLSALRDKREISGKELRTLLGISQSTLPRLTTAAGDRVCRSGRARAARYTLTRSLPALGTRLPIRQVNETGAIQTYGTLHLLANGRHWLERESGASEFFEGLPPFAWDMSPQGYIGRTFPAQFPDLGLPPRITDWSDDHRLIALARRGEDCIGDLIIGDESCNRFLAGRPSTVRREEYPELARRSLEGQPGSSAGGEQPKFAVYAEGRHVLVKFAAGESGPVTQRWQDLLFAERAALEAVRAAGLEAAHANLFDIGGARFLEVERFDRVGVLGRKALVSLFVLGAEHLGHLESWTRAARDLLEMHRIDETAARRMRWLDAFGQLIGNTDRHFGNISFFAADDGSLRLAPVYDMLPMLFAPQGTHLVPRRFEALPPNADNFDVWPDAARHAEMYWDCLAAARELSRGFRELSASCRDAVDLRAGTVPGP